MGDTSRADGSQSDNFLISGAGKVQWSLDCDWVGNDIGRAAGKGETSTGNPYTAVQQYLNPGYAASVNAAVRAALPSKAPFFASVAQYATAVWLDTMAALDPIPGHLSDAATQAGGKAILVQFVIYDLPGRDCKAWSSNGEIPKGGLDTYRFK
ncbi:unnamed protein product [Closterium sp. NIES-64]|nr:unnamed protein product [Closterium sp. NIES-64]